jgi:hypothetical protein
MQICDPASINQHGNAVFATANPAGTSGLGIYRLDDQTRQITPVARKGMSALSNLAFEDAGFWFPTINNHDEIVFPASVKTAAGKTNRGIFFRGADSQLQAVALPDDPLPGGGKLLDASAPTINDAGVVSFLATKASSSTTNVYLWEKGALMLIAGPSATGPVKVNNPIAAYVNNKNSKVLVVGSPSNLYLWSNGALTPVAVRGQTMPGGGQLRDIIPWVSFANESGQHAFLARLMDQSTAAYRMEADGTLSLILKSGTTTELGTITQVGGSGNIALNSKGQVAVAVQIAGKPDALVLLTPKP